MQYNKQYNTAMQYNKEYNAIKQCNNSNTITKRPGAIYIYIYNNNQREGLGIPKMANIFHLCCHKRWSRPQCTSRWLNTK